MQYLTERMNEFTDGCRCPYAEGGDIHPLLCDSSNKGMQCGGVEHYTIGCLTAHTCVSQLLERTVVVGMVKNDKSNKFGTSSALCLYCDAIFWRNPNKTCQDQNAS